LECVLENSAEFKSKLQTKHSYPHPLKKDKGSLYLIPFDQENLDNYLLMLTTLQRLRNSISPIALIFSS